MAGLAATGFAAVRPTSQMTNASGSRIQSVDALRGAIMVLMAVDHVRDYTSYPAMHFNPVDLSRTTAVIFLTRWVTHFCAPVFAFTAGIGAFFWYQHGRSKSQLSRFLITRGLWLMFLEFTVVRFLYFFQVQWRGSFVILTVFWMLGLSMVVLAALAHLPMKILAALSVLVIAGHNLLDPVSAASFGRFAPLWNVLHQLGAFPVAGGNVLVAYTLVPWFAVMSAGFCFGPILLWDPTRRRSFLVRLGLVLSVAFVLLRAWNHYGDPVPWSHQPTTLFTFLSFLNTTKYPPSLLFLLMTLGPALIALAWLERVRFSRDKPLIAFGRVPFFYFLFHFAVAHLLAIGLGALRYGPHRFLLLAPPSLGTPADAFPPDYGFRLYVVYLCWLLVVATAYPVCRWYADVKNRRRDLWWLSYL